MHIPSSTCPGTISLPHLIRQVSSASTTVPSTSTMLELHEQIDTICCEHLSWKNINNADYNNKETCKLTKCDQYLIKVDMKFSSNEVQKDEIHHMWNAMDSDFRGNHALST